MLKTDFFAIAIKTQFFTLSTHFNLIRV